MTNKKISLCVTNKWHLVHKDDENGEVVEGSNSEGMLGVKSRAGAYPTAFNWRTRTAT